MRLAPAALVALAGVAGPSGCGNEPLPGQPSRGTVSVTLDRFGVGNVYRPGEMTAMRVTLNSGLDEPQEVWVQWEVPNADGDIGEYGGKVTLTPGRDTPLWLYAPIDPETSNQTIWPVRVFEWRDGRRRRELGGAPITPASVGASPAMDLPMIAVVGTSSMRLSEYAGSIDPASGQLYATHEPTRVVFGIRPTQLPDRWYGLLPFEAVVWSNQAPSDLTADPAEAIRQYIERGGHFVIILPPAGDPWGLGSPGATELADLLPTAPPRRDESVPVSTLLPLLSKSRGVARDIDTSIWVFGELSRTPVEAPYEPFLALPDGRVVAIQRRLGHGRITLVGLNIDSGQLNSLPLASGANGLPQADVFWNRVLGRRADTPSSTELKLIGDARMLSSTSPTDVGLIPAPIAAATAMSPEAARGMLLAILLFVVYWLAAGPGGFIVLKQRGLAQHAWLGFAAAAGLFTAVAWGGVELLRENHVKVRHYTILDHIARPAHARDGRSDEQLQRAVSWFSVFVPGYRETPIEISGDDDTRDLLFSWIPLGTSLTKFTNPDRYLVNIRSRPAAYDMPTRATSTQIYAHWLGGVDRAWGGMIRDMDPTGPRPVGVRKMPGRRERLEGTLIHELPGPLQNVLVIWVHSDRIKTRQYVLDGTSERPWVLPGQSGELLNRGEMWALAEWRPGEPLALHSEQFRPDGQTELKRNLHERYIKPHEDQRTGIPSSIGIRRLTEMLSFFNNLEPPKYLKANAADRQSPPNVTVQRRVGRELDLSAWLTRPCLIVLGSLRNSDCPIPLQVDGEPPQSDGTTVVRWIYPLELDVQDAFDVPAGAAGSGGRQPPGPSREDSPSSTNPD